MIAAVAAPKFATHGSACNRDHATTVRRHENTPRTPILIATDAPVEHGP